MENIGVFYFPALLSVKLGIKFFNNLNVPIYYIVLASLFLLISLYFSFFKKFLENCSKISAGTGVGYGFMYIYLVSGIINAFNFFVNLLIIAYEKKAVLSFANIKNIEYKYGVIFLYLKNGASIYATSTFGIALFFILFSLFIAHLIKAFKIKKEIFKLKPISFKEFLRLILFFYVTNIFSKLLYVIYYGKTSYFKISFIKFDFSALFKAENLAPLLAAPITEELMFRYFIMTFYFKKFKNFYIANSIQALLFSMYHVDIYGERFFPLFFNRVISGVFLGWVYKKYGFAYAVIVHMVMNFIVIMPSLEYIVIN